MKEINNKNIREFMSSGGFLYVSASWCGPCKKFGPMLEAVRSNHPEKTFGKILADNEVETLKQIDVRGVPALIYYNEGKEVSRVVGATTASEIELFIKQCT